jgi:hypothetical protein
VPLTATDARVSSTCALAHHDGRKRWADVLHFVCRRSAQRSVFSWCRKPVSEFDPSLFAAPRIFAPTSGARERELLLDRASADCEYILKEAVRYELSMTIVQRQMSTKSDVTLCLITRSAASVRVHQVRTFGTVAKDLVRSGAGCEDIPVRWLR